MPVTCRKCGGPHFTTKCGKEEKKEYTDKPEKIIKTKDEITKPKNRRQRRTRLDDFDKNEKIFKVHLDNLPYDISLTNLNKMLLDWGKIGKVIIKKKDKINYALIDFYDNEQREYFINAIDGTPVGNMIVHAKKY